MNSMGNYRGLNRIKYKPSAVPTSRERRALKMMQAIINYAWLELPRERPYSKKFGGKSTRLVCCYLPSRCPVQ